MVRIPHHPPVAHERIHLRLRQTVARLDRGPTRQAVEHLVDQHGGVGPRRRGGEPVDHLADDRRRRRVAGEGRLGCHDHGGAAEGLDMHARTGQRGGMLRDELHLHWGEVDPLWNQQGLDLEAAPRHRGLQALVEHPLVQGMLVDHLDALDGLDDDVAVVHLHGAFLDDAADVRPLRFVPFPDGHGQLPRRLARRFHRTEGRRRDGERLTGRLHLQWPPLHGLRRPEPRRQRGLRSRRSGRPQPGSHVAGEECRSQRREHEPVQPRRVAKPHLHLGRVHVHVDHVGGHLELEEHDRLPSG